MKYLRNLVTKFHYITDKIIQIEKNQAELHSLLVKGFRATGTAFEQTKTVCNAIVNEQISTKQALDSYGGVIEGSTFDYMAN